MPLPGECTAGGRGKKKKSAVLGKREGKGLAQHPAIPVVRGCGFRAPFGENRQQVCLVISI